MKQFIIILTYSLFLLHSLNGFSQLPQVKSYYPSAGLQAKVLEYGFGEELFAPSLYYKATFLNNRGTYFSFGASVYPTLTVSPSNYKGTLWTNEDYIVHTLIGNIVKSKKLTSKDTLSKYL